MESLSQQQQPFLLPAGRCSVKRSLPETEAAVVKRRRVAAATQPGKYQRYPKPPYTYLGMMVVAIETSPTKRLTLVALQDKLAEMFAFFKGEYRGWRDSVRHNLSGQKCFVRIPRLNEPNSKGCYWSVDRSHVPSTAFKRSAKRDVGDWAETLFLQLGIPEIHLPARQPVIKSEETKQLKQLHPKGSFTIDRILNTTDTKSTSLSEPPDVKFNHPYSFLGYSSTVQYAPMYENTHVAMLYQNLNRSSFAHPGTSLCPEQRYGDSDFFAFTHQEHDFSYSSAPTDQSRVPPPVPVQTPTSTLSPLSNIWRSYDVNGDQQTPKDYTKNLNNYPIFSTETGQDYFPLTDSLSHYRTQPASYHYPTSSSSVAYDSDTSGSFSQLTPPSYLAPAYQPPSSDSSECSMDPPLSVLPPRPHWEASMSNFGTCQAYSAPASLTTAVDDLALFSDESSSSFRPYIPVPVFSDDSQDDNDHISMSSSSATRDTASVFSDINVVNAMSLKNETFPDLGHVSSNSAPHGMGSLYNFNYNFAADRFCSY